MVYANYKGNGLVVSFYENRLAQEMENESNESLYE